MTALRVAVQLCALSDRLVSLTDS